MSSASKVPKTIHRCAAWRPSQGNAKQATSDKPLAEDPLHRHGEADSTGILKVDSHAPAAYVRRGPHPSPARTRMPYVSASGVGQAALQDAPAAAPTTLAARGGKGGSVTNTHPTRRTILHLLVP